MKYVLIFLISTSCFGWFMVKPNDTQTKANCNPVYYTPTEFIRLLQSPDGGYSGCSIKIPEKNVNVIICKYPDNQWLMVRSGALCLKFKDIDYAYSVISKY